MLANLFIYVMLGIGTNIDNLDRGSIRHKKIPYRIDQQSAYSLF